MNYAHLSFNNGEISPYLKHRIDLDKIQSSAEEMRNFIATPYGAFSKRPGIQYLTPTLSAGDNSALFPFIASDGSRYLLHFTSTKLTIYRADGTTSATLDAFTHISPPTPPTPTPANYYDAPLRLLQVVAINDIAFITHPESHPLRLSRISDTAWTLDFIPFSRPPLLDPNIDKDQKFSVLSNPIANAWTTSTAYVIGNTVLQSNIEWTCTANHSSSATTQPGIGATWKTVWRRKIYMAGDPITINGTTVSSVPFANSFALNTTRTIGGSNYICTQAHTPGKAEEAPASGSPESKWAIILPFNENEFAQVNDYRNQGVAVLKCISAITSIPTPLPFLNPSNWVLVGSITPPVQSYTPLLTPIPQGTIVSHNGRTWKALADISPFLISGGISGQPSQGNNWTEILQFSSAYEAAPASPGTYMELSPKRDDKDFQVDLVAIVANNNTFSQPITVQGNWKLSTYGTWTGIFLVQRSDDNGVTWETISSYEASGDRNIADTSEEPTAVLLRLGFQSATGTATSGKQRAVIEPEKQSITGYALAKTYVSPSRVTGTALTTLMSGSTPNWTLGAFSRVTGFPVAVTLHEQRLCFGGTQSRPSSLWLSQTDDLLNFEQNTEDSGSIFVTLTSTYPIHWIISQRRLFIGFSNSLWIAGSDTDDAPLTPTGFNARTYTATGSHTLAPLLAADSLFFLDRKGSRLHQLTFSSDTESYEPIDLSRLAEHLTQPGITSIDYQQTREPCLYATTRDGCLLMLAYSRRDSIQAWTRHTTGMGAFRDVAIIPSELGDDDVFFILDTPSGSILARFPQNFQAIQETGQNPLEPTGTAFPYFYVDGLTARGTGLTSITVPTFLQGQALTLITVSAAGEETVSTVTPTSGTLSIPSCSRYLLGFPIHSTYRSLPIDMQGTHAMRKRIHRVSLSLYRSKGGHIHVVNETSKRPIPYPTNTITTAWTDTLPDAGNTDDAQLSITHSEPYPFTVRTAICALEVNERR